MAELKGRMQGYTERINALNANVASIPGQEVLNQVSEILSARAEDLESYVNNPESDSGSPSNQTQLMFEHMGIATFHNHFNTKIATTVKGSMPKPEGALKRLLDKAKPSQASGSGTQ